MPLDLDSLLYPRHLHKADGLFLHVDTATEAREAVADGWQLTPVLTAEQTAAVHAAQIAAGERPADAVPVSADPAPAAKPPKAPGTPRAPRKPKAAAPEA